MSWFNKKPINMIHLTTSNNKVAHIVTKSIQAVLVKNDVSGNDDEATIDILLQGQTTLTFTGLSQLEVSDVIKLIQKAVESLE